MATAVRRRRASKQKLPILKKEMRRPTASDLYHWCDFIELKCLVDSEKRLSRGKILELLEDTAQQHGEQNDADDTAIVDDDVEYFEEVDEEGDLEHEMTDAPVGFKVPDSDLKNIRVASYFTNLKYRAEIFGDAYPFGLSEDGQEVFLRGPENNAQELYIQLLLSSSLRLIPDTRWKELTEPFEEMSAAVWGQIMPKGWMVHRFGAKGSTRYTGILFEKLKALAADIRTKFLLEERHFKPGNRGDGGLDLVAWHPMGDQRDGIPIALAQCGCTADEWSKKSLESSPARLMPHLPAVHPWATYYFMPHELTDTSGSSQDWQCRNQLSQCIIVDRLRIINLARDYEIIDACLTARPFVVEALGISY